MQLHNSFSYITPHPPTTTTTTHSLRIQLLAIPASFHGNSEGGAGGWGGSWVH